jgi:hypothetical protein
MEHINTEEATRRSLADEHGDEDAAIARSIVDEVARQQAAAKQPASADTNERQGQRRAQHNIPHARAQPPAVARSDQVRLDLGGKRGQGLGNECLGRRRYLGCHI